MLMKSFPRLGLALLTLALVSCQKTPPAANTTAAKSEPSKSAATNVEVVKEKERSKNFLAVQKQLELGGTLYGYVDVEGDVQKVMTVLQGIMGMVAEQQPQAAFAAQLDFQGLAATLGLTDIKAVGLSSVPEGDGFFRNRAFFYTGGERHGLMAALGGKPAPFKHVKLAPADAAFYGEAELDVSAVYKTIKQVVGKIAGEPAGDQLEQQLKKAGDAAALSFLDLIYGLKGRSAIVMRVDAEKTFRTPGPQGLVLPQFQLLLTVDGVGQVIEPSLANLPMLRRSESGTQHIYALAQRMPIEGLQPALVIDGTQLYFTTSLDFLKECRELKSGLEQAPEFQKALAQVGKEGNGLTYVSPKFFDQIRRIESLNPNLPPDAKPIFAYLAKNLPTPDRPLIANRINLDDGILIRAHMNRSFKQDIAAAAVYPAGMMAAMAIPAFQKTRSASQEKAVLNNLRMLAAAADQYYLENGVTKATYDQLVGPDKYVKLIAPVMGENYRRLVFEQGKPLIVRLPDGREVRYDP